jgi:hypothetical protein
VMAFNRQDRRLTIRMVADELNECTVYQIVTKDFNMREVCKDVSKKNLNDEKARRHEVSAEMLELLETEPDFLIRS